jgi:hypothetical protein
MVPPSRLVLAIAGALATDRDVVVFAFACNVDCADEAAADTPAATFRAGVAGALTGIERQLAATMPEA